MKPKIYLTVYIIHVDIYVSTILTLISLILINNYLCVPYYDNPIGTQISSQF